LKGLAANLKHFPRIGYKLGHCVATLIDETAIQSGNGLAHRQ
jgi:hypothetical protein